MTLAWVLFFGAESLDDDPPIVALPTPKLTAQDSTLASIQTRATVPSNQATVPSNYDKVPTLSAGRNNFIGRVTDRESLEVIAGAMVRIHSGAPPEERIVDCLLSDNEGFFHCSVPDGDAPWLQIGAVGYAPTCVEATKDHHGRDTAAEVPLARPACLVVDVLSDEGTPLRGVNVSIFARYSERIRSVFVGSSYENEGMAESEVVTDTMGGDFSRWCQVFSGLPPHVPLSITVRYGAQILDESMVTLDPRERRGLKIRIPLWVKVLGTMVDQDGVPVSEYTVGFVESTGTNPSHLVFPAVLTATTDATGHFELPILPGDWIVGPVPIEDARVELKSDSNWVAPFGAIVSVPRDRERVHFTLHVSRGVFTQGYVLLPDGRGAPGVEVSTGRPYGSATTDARGMFRIGPLQVGDHLIYTTVPETLELAPHSDQEDLLLTLDGAALEAALARRSTEIPEENSKPNHSSNYHALPVLARAGEENVLIQLKTACALSGEVLDAISGQPCEAEIEVITGRESFVATSEAGGTFEMMSLPPGSYSMLAFSRHNSSAIQKHGVELVEGTRTRLLLWLKPAGSVRVWNESDGTITFRVGTSLQEEELDPYHSRVRIVPPGDVTVEFRDCYSGQTRIRLLSVTAGQEENVVYAGEATIK